MAGELEMSDARPWRERYGVAAIIESIEATGYDEIDWERGFTLLHLAAMHGDKDRLRKEGREGEKLAKFAKICKLFAGSFSVVSKLEAIRKKS